MMTLMASFIRAAIYHPLKPMSSNHEQVNAVSTADIEDSIYSVCQSRCFTYPSDTGLCLFIY